MSGVVAKPDPVHCCNPGWESRHHENDPTNIYSGPSGYYLHDLQLSVGTVWECDCGKSYVCIPSPYINVFSNDWRRERRREKRRRLKRVNA